MLRFQQKVFERLTAAADSLANEPRPRNSDRLEGRGPMRRLRVGDYRIGYTVFDPDRVVAIDFVERRTTTTYKKR